MYSSFKALKDERKIGLGMSYKAKFHSEEIEQLFEAILKLEDVEECYKFFEDLCTIKEIQSLSQRFQVACQLDAGKNYNQVSADTGVSSATISSRAVANGVQTVCAALQSLLTEGN